MKKFFAILALACFTLGANAQDVPTEKYSVATNSFWDNWFIEVGADYNMFYSDEETFASPKFSQSPFKSFRSTPGFSVAIGKWFTPGIGLRTKFQGIWGRSVISEENEINKNKSFDLQEQVMFNMSNLICGYNPNRIWNLSLFAGAGFERSMSYNKYTMACSAGIHSSWKVADRVSIYAEGGAVFAEGWGDGFHDPFFRFNFWKNQDKKFYAELGLTFNIGKKVGWEKTPDVEALKAMYQSQIDGLNGQLNDANAEIARLKNLLANQKPAQTVTKVISCPVTVWYNIGKTEIVSEKDLLNVKNFAEAASANNVKVEVVGYADASTGTPEINATLSQGRAETLANKLVELGVNRDNISIASKGGVSELSPVSLDRRATATMK